MSMVAMGGADVNYEFGIHAWDIAAGQLLVEEAGGVCIDPSGKNFAMVSHFNSVQLTHTTTLTKHQRIISGGPFDILSRRILCASTMELAQEMSSNLSQYYPPRD